MAKVKVDSASATPVYQQIVEQIRYLIEAGKLADGEQLPSARLLAETLRVNRNTVARAYATLREMRLITSRGPRGSIVTFEADALVANRQRDHVRDLLSEPLRMSVELGLPPDEIGRMALHLALDASSEQPCVVFAQSRQGADERPRRRSVGTSGAPSRSEPPQ